MLISLVNEHLPSLSVPYARESRDEIPLRGEGCNTPVLIVLANRGLKFVISANRVRIVNIYLVVFDLVFLTDPSLKSTFAQNESCSSSFALQLLF